uniref:Growth arrest-specific 2b n=1 Tax=Electrophorus electricus TaxID=8005 RepID=A0A4W4E301_ELEEL
MNGSFSLWQEPVPDPSFLQQYSEWLACRHEASLHPMKEDLAVWLNAVLGKDEEHTGLMDALQTGTVLCQLAEKLQERMILASNSKVLPSHADAAPGSFLARDNTANFLYWCRKIGMRESYLFESEDLGKIYNKTLILSCSLLSHRYGVDPPALVKLARETEKDEEEPLSPSPFFTSPFPSPSSPPLFLLPAVKQISEDPPCRCMARFCVEKQPKGRYRVGDKVLYVRMLNDKDVMVRVGGGWEAFGTYLLKHDPCRMALLPRPGPRSCRRHGRSANPKEHSRDSYLVVGTPSHLTEQIS